MRRMCEIRGRVLLMMTIVTMCSLVAGCRLGRDNVKRVGSVIGIAPEAIPEYKRLHADAWPEVLDKLRDVNIRNYSIYLAEVKDGEYYLFSYFEYTGENFEADMARMSEDPNTKRWWKQTKPLQTPVPTREEGEWWHNAEEVFHMD